MTRAELDLVAQAIRETITTGPCYDTPRGTAIEIVSRIKLLLRAQGVGKLDLKRFNKKALGV